MKKTPYLESKAHKISKYVLICTIILLIFCLMGCARKDPVETIVDNHIDHITDVLNYTNTNFEQTIEIKFLESELQSCMVSLDDVKQAHLSVVSTEKSKTKYWQLATFGLFIMLCGAIFAIIKRWFK